jgi:hypothetical protein
MPRSDEPIVASYPSTMLGRRFSYQGKVYLADSLGMRWITNPTVYNALFRDWTGITVLTNPSGSFSGEQEFVSYMRSGTPDYQLFMYAPQGRAIPDGAALMKDPAAPEVYLVEQGMKRHIVSPDIMNQYFFNWNAIQLVPTATLAPLQTGSALDATSQSLVQLQGSTPMYFAFFDPLRELHLPT